jgi:cell wall-associated NlpC family hydrolase
MPSRREIIDRAMVWVRAQVPYSQVRYRDGYRTDCSGFVSMAWMLPRSYWTGDLNTAGRRVALRDCQPGDMLLFHNLADPHDGSHVVIFDGWVDRNLGDFWILE